MKKGRTGFNSKGGTWVGDISMGDIIFEGEDDLI
jgi:hypothetical protein